MAKKALLAIGVAAFVVLGARGVASAYGQPPPPDQGPGQCATVSDQRASGDYGVCYQNTVTWCNTGGGTHITKVTQTATVNCS